MRIIILTLVISSISLTACSSMSGNVVPEKGPTMEQVYDSMEATDATSKTKPQKIRLRHALPLYASNNTFHKLPNPELKMYVSPHLAGKDEVPIPGYYTAFNAYTQDHYILPNETIRE
jgi:conjugative transfer region lipoprotein (TIGR03751 family)